MKYPPYLFWIQLLDLACNPFLVKDARNSQHASPIKLRLAGQSFGSKHILNTREVGFPSNISPEKSYGRCQWSNHEYKILYGLNGLKGSLTSETLHHRNRFINRSHPVCFRLLRKRFCKSLFLGVLYFVICDFIIVHDDNNHDAWLFLCEFLVYNMQIFCKTVEFTRGQVDKYYSLLNNSELTEFGTTSGVVFYSAQALTRTTCLFKKYEPAHEIMVLVTQATSEGSGMPAHLRSLTRAFAVRTHEVWK